MPARTRGIAAAAASAVVVAGLLWLVRHERDSGDASPSALSTPQADAAQMSGPASEAVDAAPAGPPPPVELVSPSGVRIRVQRLPRIDTPEPPYGPKLAALNTAARAGDVIARYRLGLMLYQCRDVPADEAGLRRTIEEIHQTRSRGGWDVADPAQEDQALRTAYGHCAGVPAESRLRYREQMRAAADAGLIEAQLNLMFHLPPGEYCQYLQDCSPEQVQRMNALRDEARLEVGKALQGGSVEALRTVGGWFLNEEMDTPDPVEAYAHFSAYDQVQQAAGRERELTAMLDGLRGRLRPVDLERAEARARELLSNPRCCVLTR